MKKKTLRKVAVFLLLTYSFFQLIACKTAFKKVQKRFPDETPSVIFEYADKSDTLNYLIKAYYHNGKIRQEVTIKNGNFLGKFTTYYPNGKISEIDSLSNTRIMKLDDWDGIATHFYENGKISKRSVIKNGEINGLSQQYDNKGILVKEYFLIHDSIKNGEYTEFYDDGKVALKDIYQNDTLVGVEYTFKENGDTLKYNSFYKGNASLPIKKWLENGNILEGNYIDKNEKIVIWRWYNKNGKEIKRKISYPIKGQYISPE